MHQRKKNISHPENNLAVKCARKDRLFISMHVSGQYMDNDGGNVQTALVPMLIFGCMPKTHGALEIK